MDLGSGRRRSAGSAGERVYLGGLHIPRCTVRLALHPGQSEGYSTARKKCSTLCFVPIAAQSGPPSKASQRAGQLLGRTSSARDSVLVTPFQSLLVLRYSSTAHPPALPVAALLLSSAALPCPSLPHPVNQFDPLAAGPVHACVHPDDGLSYS